MYNSVNHTIVDKEKLEKFDSMQYNKKKRFELRYDIEDYYRNKNFEEDARKESTLATKLSYDRYKVTDNRGYDIVNMKNNFEHYKNTVNTKGHSNEWEHLLSKAGEKETFNEKGIYRDPYDYTDNDKIAHLFKIGRQSNIIILIN